MSVCMIDYLPGVLHMHLTTHPAEVVKRAAPEPRAECDPSAEPLNKADAGLASQRERGAVAMPPPLAMNRAQRPGNGLRPRIRQALPPEVVACQPRAFQPSFPPCAELTARPELFVMRR